MKIAFDEGSTFKVAESEEGFPAQIGDSSELVVSFSGDDSFTAEVENDRFNAEMATPREYDGPYIITPSYEDQGLPTTDRVLRDDILVEAMPDFWSGITASSSDVKSGKMFRDNTGELISGSYVWNMIGDDWTKLSTVYDSTFKLSTTTYGEWTPSTSAGKILDSSNVGTFVADMSQYDYLLRWRCITKVEYESGTVPKVAPNLEGAEIWQAILKRPNSYDTVLSESFIGNGCVTLYTAPLSLYYNSSGKNAYSYSASYGIYPSATAATFSNSTTDTTTVTIKSPTLNARCSTTYMSTAMAAKIDTDKTKTRFIGELYRSKQGAVTRSMYNGLIELFNGGYI